MHGGVICTPFLKQVLSLFIRAKNLHIRMKPYIKNITPFKYLSDEELQHLMTLAQVYMFEDEEVIIKQGEFDQSLFAVLKGSVKVTVDNEQEDAYICTLGTSEIFGEAGMFMNAERTANVISLDQAIIFKNILPVTLGNIVGGALILLIHPNRIRQLSFLLERSHKKSF